VVPCPPEGHGTERKGFILRAMHEYVELANEACILPPVRVIQGASTEPEVQIAGRKVLQFCSSNYLGLATHPEVKQAVAEALAVYGVGANGSRVISGTTDLHVALEDLTARYKGTEAALAFSAGFMANTGTIPAFAYAPTFARMCAVPLEGKTAESVIVSDALNHASIIDGCELARGKHVSYQHADLDALERKLEQNRGKRLLIVTDGIFSMDGDIAPLPGIIALANEYDAGVLLDDAHASGVLGKTGRGTLEHYGLEEDAGLMQMGTYSKSFGCLGGFVAADAETVEYLRWAARPYMFSGAMPPCLAAGIIKSIEISLQEPERRLRLWDNRDYLVANLASLGFDTLGSETPIIPIFIGDDAKAKELSDELFANGLFVPSVVWPAVARGQARLRITLMASHERGHLDRLIDGMAGLGRRFGVI
jgi:glycine C-acetyltransferase